MNGNVVSDLRGWHVALMPDALVNPPSSHRTLLLDVLSILEANSYGVLQLPPPTGKHSLLLAVIADQVAEYAHHGYAVVAIGARGQPGNGLHWRHLSALLRHREIALPPRYLIDPDGDAPAERQRLGTFLANHDLPVEEQRRWRV